MQLLGKPAIKTDTAEVLGARRRDTPGQAIKDCKIVRIDVAGGMRAVTEVLVDADGCQWEDEHQGQDDKEVGAAHTIFFYLI